MKKTQEPRENEKVFEKKKKKKIKVVWEGEKQLVVVSSIFKNLERTSHTGTDTHDVHSHTHTHALLPDTRERNFTVETHEGAQHCANRISLEDVFKKKRVVCFVVQVKPTKLLGCEFFSTHERIELNWEIVIPNFYRIRSIMAPNH
jgi:hypothetical protein